ncbi:MAG: hotdog fold domain-containing protein, partial [Maribacter sp.]
YLLGQEADLENLKLGMSSSQMEFSQPVLPGETVRVVSNLTYFRFQKLKCEVKMYNETGTLVCKGTLAGMISTTHG